MIFKAKPALVEAHQIPVEPEIFDLDSIFRWMKKDGGASGFGVNHNGTADFYFPHGRLRATFGWWVVKGCDGKFTALPPEIFAQTYQWIGPSGYDAPYLVN